jgi:peptidoglycan hydrolase-like protein with peptidoglycan-binding domain
MEGHEDRGPGYDDWFDEPEPPTETQSGANRGVHEDADEVWVLPEDEEAHSAGQREFVIGGRTLTMTQVAIIALCVLAVFFAILAAAGVFDSGTATVPPVTTPTVTHPATTASTPTNTTPAAVAPSTTLKPGDTGEQVKTLQHALTALGYPVTADGDYGPATQAAVVKFQTAKGLTPDGVVGPVTLAELQKALGG